jgi:tripartite-type tricarboxylate transporter receptor subunit TctC
VVKHASQFEREFALDQPFSISLNRKSVSHFAIYTRELPAQSLRPDGFCCSAILQKGVNLLMSKTRVLLYLLFVAAFVLQAPIQTFAQDFYKNKTLNFVVGTSAGGGFDTYTRVMARHINRYIPGNPTTVVNNMPGAGGLVAANYMYNTAKPDGLTVGLWAGSFVLGQRLGQQGVQFDARRFEWMGAPIRDTPVCALTKASGITNLDEWFASKRPIKLGGNGPGSTPSIPVRVIKAALGLPIQLIDGFKGTGEIRLAAESGEIDGGCWDWSSIKSTWRRALDAGDVKVVLQINANPHPDLAQVPNAIAQAKSEYARRLIKVGVHDQVNIFRAYTIAAGTPKERVAILQKAFVATMKDPAFLAEAAKANLNIDPLDGEQVHEIVAEIFKLDDTSAEDLKKILLD